MSEEDANKMAESYVAGAEKTIAEVKAAIAKGTATLDEEALYRESVASNVGTSQDLVKHYESDFGLLGVEARMKMAQSAKGLESILSSQDFGDADCH